ERARAEAERLAIYERQKAEAEEKRRKEKEAAEKEAADQKEREEKAKAERETAHKQQEAEKAALEAIKVKESAVSRTSTARSKSQGSSWSSDPEIRHKCYLAIHRKLKEFRKDFWEKVKKDPMLKPHVGDMRRAMKTSVGQLTDNKAGNKIAVRRSILQSKT